MQKMRLFCRLLQTDTKNYNLGSVAYVSRHKNQFLEKKTPEPRSRLVEPRSGPYSPLLVTPRRKQFSPSPRSRPEVERAAERRHLLAEVEVDRAAMPPECRRLLG
jgi:hypothetical protein